MNKQRIARSTTQLLVIILFLLTRFQLSALEPDNTVDQYLVDQWETTDGLPSNTVISIAQTPDGYLWIATQENLVRFDGMKFSTISFVEKEKTPPGETIPPDTLFVDRKGELWIGSVAGLTLYRCQTGTFKTFTTADGLTGDRIRRIKEDMRGNLWISFYSSYMNRLHNGKFTVYNESHGLKGKKVNGMVEDRKGNLLFGTRENGVFKYKDGTFFKHFVPGLENAIIITMHEDRKGELWIGTLNGLFRVSGKGVEKYTTENGLSHNKITDIREDSERNLWIGTEKGLNRIKRKQDGTVNFESLLEPFTIMCLYEDREKSLWMGTFKSGIKQLKDGKFISFAPLEIRQENTPVSVFEDRHGDTQIGTVGGKLFRYRGNRLMETVNIPELSNIGINAIAGDADGNLWLGTGGKGVFQVKKGDVNRFTTRQGLSDDLVTSIYRDSRGNLWFSTFDGVSRYRNGVLESFKARDGLSGKRVNNVCEDKNQNIWIAADKGVTVLENGKITKQNAAYHLKGIDITCIYEDPSPPDHEDSVFWIATHGAGLKRLGLNPRTVTTYTTDHGMTTNFLYRFFEYPQGNFWIMSNKGILRIAKNELNRFVTGETEAINCTSFGISDGMKSIEFNNKFSRHSALKTGKGELWFITTRGITIVNPEKIFINKTPPPVRIEEALFDRRPIPLHPHTGNLVFKDITNFRFHFTAPTFLSPEKIKFKYQLEGFERGWIFLAPGHERIARYTNLAPGTYTFRVSACNEEGVWNETGDSIAFTLEPFFYQTLAFKITVLLLFAVLLAAAYYIYKKRPFDKKGKYKGSTLNPHFADECIKKLTKLMQVEKVYRDEKISLNSLAEKLSIPHHQLSQLLNEKLSRNFSDFINYYRIEEAKEILKTPRGAKLKITTLAMDVGFHTMTAFFKAFKKYTRMTPNRYKKEAEKKK